MIVMSVPEPCTEAVLDRAFILGIGVSAITLDRAVSTIEQWIDRRDSERAFACTGAHGVIESRHDAQLRRIHNEAGMVTPDGMSACIHGAPSRLQVACPAFTART